MNRFDFHEPRSLKGVIETLERYGHEAALLAGGTALLIDMRHGELSPQHLVSLWGVPGLAAIHRNGGLRIGALATITEVADSALAFPAYQGLREAALMLGGLQVQNMATLGGNICKASPGADMVPPLLCLDAELRLVGPDGERTTPLDGFLTGPDQTAIRPAEVLVEISLPPMPERTGSAFEKVMRRQAVDCSIVAVGTRITLAADGQTCIEARIGLGAVAPNPFRAQKAEAALAGRKIEPERVKEAARLARSEARPITDVRASAEYRQMLVEALVERAIWTAARRAAGGGSR